MFRGLGLRQTVYGNNDYQPFNVTATQPKTVSNITITKPKPINYSAPVETGTTVPSPAVEDILTQSSYGEEEEENGLGFDFLNKLYQKNKQNNQLNKQNNQYGLYKNKYDEQYSEPVFVG